jgi:hypothetical protein
MSTQYLDDEARRMSSGKSPAYKRAVERALTETKKRHANGEYAAANEAVEDLHYQTRLYAAAKPRKPALRKSVGKHGTKNRSK